MKSTFHETAVIYKRGRDLKETIGLLLYPRPKHTFKSSISSCGSFDSRYMSDQLLILKIGLEHTNVTYTPRKTVVVQHGTLTINVVIQMIFTTILLWK